MSDSVIHIPLAALDERMVQELKQQFGPADLEIRVQGMSDDWLSETDFWEIIEKLDWDKSGDDDAVLAPAVQALASLSLAHIHQFEDMLAQKLWQLDTPLHARTSLGGSPDATLSADGFLYDRCCVVANGKAFYEKVLKQPETMPVGYAFGRLLTLADKASRLKTGKGLVHIPRFNYETYSNTAAWS